MKRRLLAVALVVAFLLFAPAGVQADKFKPPFNNTAGGILTADSSCPAATHVLSSICFPDRKQTYLVFNKTKGFKRLEGGIVVVSGPIDTTSCPLPLMEVRKIGPSTIPPPPCAPGEP